jgi:hypothetical protein
MLGRPKEKGNVYFMVSDAVIDRVRYPGGQNIKVYDRDIDLDRRLRMTGKARYLGRIEDKKHKTARPIPV